MKDKIINTIVSLTNGLMLLILSNCNSCEMSNDTGRLFVDDSVYSIKRTNATSKDYRILSEDPEEIAKLLKVESQEEKKEKQSKVK